MPKRATHSRLSADGLRAPSRRAATLGLAAGALVPLLGCRDEQSRNEEAVGGQGRVVAAPSGDTLVLADGRDVRLAGLIAPTAARQEPFAAEAARRLAALVVGGAVRWEATAPDRWGRARAILQGDDGATVQEACVAAGLARVRPEPAARRLVRRLLALERAARGQGLGLWAYDAFRERAARAAASALGGYHLVVGRPHGVSGDRRGLRLHFSANPWADFTVGMEPDARAQWGDAFLARLPGSWLRVRGFVEARQGPFVRLTEADQIEVLHPGQGAERPDA